jgi:hypothetical protein
MTMTIKSRLILTTSVGLILILGYWTWTAQKIEINTLENKIVQFDELPPIVADMFRNTKKYRKEWIDGSLMTLDSVNVYQFDVSTAGPWTDYYVITKNDREKFKIPYGKAFPFIVHDNELFIPDRFNIANTETAEIAKYERYRLGR